MTPLLRLPRPLLGLFAAIGTLSCAATGAESPAPVRYFDLAAVRLLDGPFKHAQDLDRQYLLAHDVDRMLAPFRTEAGLEPKAKKYPNWESTGLEGHTAGHYLAALAQMAATGDAECRKRLDYMVAELAECQRANGDGYVGGVPGSKKIWADVAAGKIKANTFGLNGAWVPWYNLHKTFAGLRDAWLLTGSTQARDVLIRFADWCDKVVAGLSDEQMSKMLVAEHGGMNETLADVYAITGDAKYLALAKRFSHRAILDPLLKHEDRLTGLHANTQIPKVIGFARVGDLAKDAAWTDAARFFWETVIGRRSVTIGGNSVREHFHPADNFSSMIESREGPETCNTYNMLRLSEELFVADGAPARYADYYERALFNHILSSQHPQHGGFVYFTTMRPRDYRVYSKPGTCFWCCVGTGMENHGKYGRFIYAQRGGELLVNLFLASELDWKERGVKVRQETEFPDQARTRLVLSMAKPQRFSVALRYPGWVAEGALAVRINKEPARVTAKPSSYITLEREWRDGDVIEVDMPMRTTVERLPDGSDYVAFMHGPIALSAKTGTENLKGLVAGDGRMAHIGGGPLLPLDEAPMLVGDPAQLAEKVQPVPGKTLTFSAAELIQPAKFRDLELIPFFRNHDARYIVYWRTATADRYAQVVKDLAEKEAARAALEARTLDQVTPGEQQPEVEHAFAGEDTATGSDNGQAWRDAGGSFGYTLRGAPGAEMELQIRYRQTKKPRSFRVLVNDREIAAVTTPKDAPTRWLDLTVAIPPEAVPADAVLRVKFVAAESLRTAPIGGVRLLKKPSPESTPATPPKSAAQPPTPILDGYTADPAIRVFGDTYYVYPTSDKDQWLTTDFSVWSSNDLVSWKKEGMILDVAHDLKWANIKAWAPDCIERAGTFYFYFCADGKIGVATSKRPTGPFTDALGQPLLERKGKTDPRITSNTIDPYPFIDDDEQAYLYWGNSSGKVNFVKLKEDMVTIDGEPEEFVIKGESSGRNVNFREGIVVFKRGGKYYFMWSVDDARSDDYRIAYGTSDTPRGPVSIPANATVLRKNGPAKGTGHHSIVQVPGTDRWYAVYHRHAIPGGSGYQREVCLARMEFNPDGTIQPMDPMVQTFRPGDRGEPVVRGKGRPEAS